MDEKCFNPTSSETKELCLHFTLYSSEAVAHSSVMFNGICTAILFTIWVWLEFETLREPQKFEKLGHILAF